MARQVGEVRARWAWTEESVWTERMLTALERGLKGGKWFSLIDKVYAPENLRAAFAKVKANRGAPGVDHQTIEMFEGDLEANLVKLSADIRSDRYEPQAVRRKLIEKAGGGTRPLGIPTVRDRVAQTALRHVIEPIFEKTFHARSYGFRPGRGCKDALREVDRLLKRGFVHVVDADLKSYFDTIDHEILMKRIAEQLSDGRVLDLLRALLKQSVMDGVSSWNPEEGTPQGAVISPLLANIHLNPLDHLMASGGFEMVRYADDFVVLCRSREEAEAALRLVREWTSQAKLTLHPDKTHLVDVERGGGFDFLGYRFTRRGHTPRKKSLAKLKEKVRLETRRNNGHSLDRVISKLNPVLRGWFEYFKHSRRRVMEDLDGWIRRRLRSILQKRHRRAGMARTANKTWPNAYFREHGLYSLATARASLCRSSPR